MERLMIFTSFFWSREIHKQFLVFGLFRFNMFSFVDSTIWLMIILSIIIQRISSIYFIWYISLFFYKINFHNLILFPRLYGGSYKKNKRGCLLMLGSKKHQKSIKQTSSHETWLKIFRGGESESIVRHSQRPKEYTESSHKKR
jgi:hypothetical protein